MPLSLEHTLLRRHSSSSGASLVSSKLIALAESRLGERYVLGAKVPKDDPNWHGPWDCAEFASWLVFQCTGRRIGIRDGDAYTGFWKEDLARGLAKEVSVDFASRTPGCFLLRYPRASTAGHIVLVVGSNQTIEAHSAKRGVCRSKALGRRWDCGVRVKY